MAEAECDAYREDVIDRGETHLHPARKSRHERASYQTF